MAYAPPRSRSLDVTVATDEEKDDPAPDPSPGSEPAPDASADQKAAPADPSPAKDEDKKTLLDAVKSALDVKNIEDEDAPVDLKSKAEPSPAEGESKSKDEGKPETKEDVSDTALLAALDKLKADVPLNKIERFREVLTENRQLKGANDKYRALDETLTDIGNDARRMGLSNEDVAQLFAWPRLLAKDPNAAVEQLQGFAARWQEKVGQTLPSDLKQKVDDGVLDEPTAKEVAQLRAQTALDKTRTQVDTEDREKQSKQQRTTEIRDAVNSYQAELKSNDPDYTPEKHEMVVDALTALVTKHGVPTTVADARGMAKSAYDTVSKRLEKFKPQPRALSSPSIGRRLNKPAEAHPKTMREAIENALGG